MTDSDPEFGSSLASAYGDGCAEFYDELYGPLPRPVGQRLSAIAHGAIRSDVPATARQQSDQPYREPRVLELGSATGRAALALRASGIAEYVGVESSLQMIRAMRAKPDCHDLCVVHGDFAECRLPGRFDLIFALVNTFQLLPSAQRQAAAFQHLARHLQVQGCLLLECYDDPAAASGQGAFDACHRLETRSGPRDYRITGYASSSDELDAMAAGAGLSLRARWSDWQGRVWQRGEPRHISIYSRAA